MIIARSAVGDHPKHKSKSVFLSTSHMLKYLKRHKLLAAGCSINSSRCWSLWHAAEKNLIPRWLLRGVARESNFV
jgi:hypothetical protein